MLAILAVVAGVAAAMGIGLGRGSGSKGLLSGTWIGGYESQSGPTALQLRLVQQGGSVRGVVEVGIGAPAIQQPLRSGEAGGARVTLRLPNGTVLQGRHSGGLISGRARAKSGRGRFELRLLQPEPAGDLQQAAGLYRFADGSVVSLYVEPLGTHLRILDYGSGEMRQLWQVSHDAFVGGPRLLAPWPVQARVDLLRDAAGRVVALRRNGREADRLPLLVEPARFRDGAVRLVGKLMRPPGPGPFPAVVLVAGSERATRNTFDLWGLFFASRGFAVLSYDKRGVGQSSGRFVAFPSRANVSHLADDAVAAAAWLRRQTGVDPRRIGLSGGSQAGWIIPLAATRSRDVAFAAIQSGPAMSVGRERGYSAVTGNGSVVPPPSRAQIEAALATRGDAGFDPRPALKALRIPVLWQLGGVDKRQYTPETVANLDAIAAQGHDFTTRIYPGGAHSLRETRHGLISEELLASGFAPGLFSDLAAWLERHVRAPSGGR